MTELRGIFPIVYTAFHADGQLDRTGQRRIVDHLIGAGAHGLAVTGGASETALLSPDERRELLEVCVTQVAGRVPVIMGASAPTVEESLAVIRHGASWGVCAAFCLLPPATATLHGDDLAQALRRHFLTLGEASPLPVLVQEVAQSLPAEAIAAIAETCPNVIGVKEEAPDTGKRISALREASGGRLVILSGGANLLDDLARGAVGAIPGSIGVADLATAYDRHVAGDHPGARRAFTHFLPLAHWRRPFPLIGAKEVLRRQGVINCANVRVPEGQAVGAQTLDAHDLQELDEVMATQGPPY